MKNNIIGPLAVFLAVFFLSMVALATPISPVIEYDGNILQLSTEEINALLPEGCPEINEESWPPVQDESLGELDLKEYTFEDLQTPYLVVKAGKTSYVYRVAGLSTFDWESPNNKGLSYYASVPDASIMFLLGPALIVLGIIGRKKRRE